MANKPFISFINTVVKTVTLYVAVFVAYGGGMSHYTALNTHYLLLFTALQAANGTLFLHYCLKSDKRTVDMGGGVWYSMKAVARKAKADIH